MNPPNPPHPAGQQFQGQPAFLTTSGVRAFFPVPPAGAPSVPQSSIAPLPAVEEALMAFVPHVLSDVEIRDLRLDCQRRIRLIEALEIKKAQIAPQRDDKIQERLAYERADLSIRYFRIFRINDLPNEILANIFRFYVWAVDSPQQGILVRLHVTWICRHWRNVAIADSTLWSAVWFRDRPPHNRSWAFLDRAGNTMLDIRVNDSAQAPMTDEQMQHFMKRLVPKLPHVRMLIILLQEWEPVLTVLKKLSEAGQSGWPIGLERFELHRLSIEKRYLWPGQRYQPVGHTRTLYPAFGGAVVPSLKYFSVNAVHFDWDKTVLRNLTTLDLRQIPIELSPKPDIFRRLLLDSPRLEKLSFDGAGPNVQPSYYNMLGAIQMHYLHTLVVANFTLHYAWQVFSHLDTPNLRDLTLMNFLGDYTPLYTRLISRFPKVKLMTLYGISCPITPEGVKAMMGFLNSMPQLSYLRIASVGLDVLQAFLYDAETFQLHPKFIGGVQQFFHMAPLQERSLPLEKPEVRLIAPNLTTLECEAMDSESLKKFVAARIIAGAPIRKIYLAGPMPNLTRDDLQKLAGIVQLHHMQPGARTPEELALQTSSS